ncbi:MAG: hypothetical protein H0T76_00610 [Nannocystis sp.]|nr:hypothetical protein [Nannocystis sp.]MBA3544961.1 hypothetical protein [Nannocystis sp.]
MTGTTTDEADSTGADSTGLSTTTSTSGDASSSTGGDASTGESTGGGLCDDVSATYPDLEVLVHTSAGTPLVCGGEAGVQFTARVHVVGPAAWTLERCNANTCLNDLPCNSDVFALTIMTADASVLPALQDNGCYYFGVLGREPLDPQTCKSRVFRVAEAAGKPSLFAAGIDANAVPQAWRTITGLYTKAGEQVKTCGDGAPCGAEPGVYALDVYWGKSALPVTVGPGETIAGAFKLLAPNNNEVSVPGTFSNLRSYVLADPGCATSVQWKWVWLADALKG